jgi:hypothetical protein
MSGVVVTRGCKNTHQDVRIHIKVCAEEIKQLDENMVTIQGSIIKIIGGLM